MTWFANEILAPAVPSLLEEIASFPGYREAAHVIRTLSSHHFHDDAVRHGLPSQGLLIVRPVGEPSELEGWYEEGIVPWLPPPGWSLHEIVVTPEQVTSLLPTVSDLPPDDFLRALKGLAARHQTPVAYGYFSTWGGSNELEYAWSFGDDEAVLINTSVDPRHFVLRSGHPPVEAESDLLQALCVRLGFALPTPYFAPHARSFDWEEHLLVPARRSG